MRERFAGLMMRDGAPLQLAADGRACAFGRSAVAMLSLAAAFGTAISRPQSHCAAPAVASPQVEEGWVQCDQCEGWVHQICGLFNKGRNDQNRGFLCPFCLRDGGCTAWMGGVVGLGSCSERNRAFLCPFCLRGGQPGGRCCWPGCARLLRRAARQQLPPTQPQLTPGIRHI